MTGSVDAPTEEDAEEGFQWSHWTDTTFLLLNLTSLVEAADLTVLPSVFQEISLEFDVTPAQLGSLTLLRGLLQAFASPLAGIFGGRYDRATLIGMGCVFWGVATAGIGFASSFEAVTFWRSINGIGLGVVLPLIQSLNSDLHPQHRLGKSFGILNITGALGGTAGAYMGTVLAAGTVAGIAGWR